MNKLGVGDARLNGLICPRVTTNETVRSVCSDRDSSTPLTPSAVCEVASNPLFLPT